MSTSFKFKLEQRVVIVISGEKGHVIGRCEYSEGIPPSYLVRFVAKDGRAVESWWNGDALDALEVVSGA